MPAPELSPIERRVVDLVAYGATTRAIADRLGVRTRTVEWHLARARRKLEQTAALHDLVQRVERAAPPEGGMQ